MSFILSIASIGEADLELIVKAITSLVTYLGQYPKRFFDTKDVLYMAKIVASLSITCNRSKMTQKSNSITNFPNIKLVQDTFAKIYSSL